MRTNLRYGGKLECDYPKCAAQFTTNSLAAMVREQASLHEGWVRVPRWQIEDDAAPDDLVDLCKKHAKVAAAGKARRAEQLKEARDKVKAERAELRDAKKAVKAAEKAQKAAARESERAAKKSAKAAAREVTRAKKKAQKLENKIRGAEVHVASAEPARAGFVDPVEGSPV